MDINDESIMCTFDSVGHRENNKKKHLNSINKKHMKKIIVHCSTNTITHVKMK